MNHRERAEVVVLGLIHGGHRTSRLYSLDRVRDIVRRIRPDTVLAEIPPDRFSTAWEQHLEGQEVSEPRVSAFPEYVKAILPVQRELGYEIVPCSAWTKGMADRRRDQLKRWQTDRPQQSADVAAAARRMNSRLTDGHRRDDPKWIHTSEYDEIVRVGMETADRLWNRDLGPGGWSNINRAHYRLIDEALASRAAPGRRILIAFGAWHKHWLQRELRRRDDITVVPAAKFL